MISEAARCLGRRGGLSRGRRLSKERLSEIALMGSRARADSIRLAKAIHNNFDYLSAIARLRPPQEVPEESCVGGRLQGVYGGEDQAQDRQEAAGSARSDR